MVEMSQYQEFIYKSRYSRWIDQENRRENWPETISRYMNYISNHLQSKHGYKMPISLYRDLVNSIRELDVMPSMRALMTAGPALDRDHIAGYNCSYLPVDHPRAFDEALYILMNGTGVGFSVERNYVSQLPAISETFEKSATVIHVEDSKKGWAKALKELISMLYSGLIPTWDMSKVRPAGSKLKTFGGRASGPEPLDDLFRFCVAKFTKAAGAKLNSLDCHDIMCKIGEVVVVGGVRRSAMISLSNLTDDRMRHAKSGQWWNTDGHRALANNSICYTERPDIGSFMQEWLALYESKSGERGIFNRVAAKAQAGSSGRRDTEHDFGTNPCSEIILRPYQFCNLSEVVCRENDTLEELHRKVKAATIIGTFQSTLTNFKYIRSIWQKNTEEERLLGVSLTGIMDCKVLRNKSPNIILQDLKDTAIETNMQYAKILGINASTAITCVKPSGTVSQLVDSSSGIHPRHSEYYVRTVRGDKKDPLTQFLIDQGVPHEDCVRDSQNTTVFSFPQKAPKDSKTRSSFSALEALEVWKVFQDNWCEHKPSVTISVKDNEWMAVGAWVWENFDAISGVSFLPYADHVYKQAPYQECTQEQYEDLVSKSPRLDWDKLKDYETQDTTEGTQTLACTGSICEIVDIGR